MGIPSTKVPYGHWTSPLTAEQLAHNRISLHEVVVNVSSPTHLTNNQTNTNRNQPAPSTQSSAFQPKMADIQSSNIPTAKTAISSRKSRA